MQIEWVELVDFRGYHSLSFAPGASVNLVSGLNGQGKTNLLEGLGVLLVGRSFRGARLGDLVRWEASGAGLAGAVRRADTVRTLRRRIEPREDGRWGLAGEGCSWVRAVPFSAQDLAVIAGAPQARRGFLDGFAAKLFPAHARACARYRQVLARRNHLLQLGVGGRDLPARLEPWNEQLAALGVEVRQRRGHAVAALRPELAELHRELAGHGALSLGYRATGGVADGDVGAARARIECRLRDEIRRGQTLEGPHRDEIEVAVDGREARTFASRGQQRVLALALRLAEARAVARAVGSPPVLLLDDPFSELDAPTQERVAHHVAGAGQVFLSASGSDVPMATALRWDLQGGTVTRAVSLLRGAA